MRDKYLDLFWHRIKKPKEDEGDSDTVGTVPKGLVRRLLGGHVIV